MIEAQNLTPEDMILLETYKCIEAGKPINTTLSIEQIVSLPSLIEELKTKEQEAETVFAEIQEIELEIQEKQARIHELQEGIDPRIQYLKSTNPVTETPKITNHTVKEEYKDITESAIMEVLKANPYGLGNSEIAKKLNLEGTKGQQNKVYAVCKKSDNIINDNRLWKLK